MSTWPTTLPALNFPHAAHNYQREPQDPTLRTPMDAGPAKVRRRYTAVPVTISFTTLLSDAQYATEQAFYNDTVKATGRFDWTDPATQQTATFRYVTPTSAVAAGGGFWRATFNLEILP